MNPSKFLKAPIPGENLTQVSRNYAWHRPPQFTEYDDVIEHFVDSYIANTDRLTSAMLLVENGVPATSAVTSILIGMVGRGVITPDMSLVVAGPLYKIVTRMFDETGTKYLTGFDTEDQMREFLDAPKQKTTKKKKLSKEQEEQIDKFEKELKEQKTVPAGGLMGAKSDTEDTMDIDAEPTGEGLVLRPQDDEES